LHATSRKLPSPAPLGEFYSPTVLFADECARKSMMIASATANYARRMASSVE